MPDEMRVNDEQLDRGDIRRLETADEIAHFFAKLRYDIDERTNIPDYAVLGLGSEDMRQHIHRIELIGKDPEDGDISIYLFEVRSVTAKLRNDIARRFRERPENALLVLTKDYEELEFVLLERIITRSRGRQTTLKQTIRPIPLTVNRLNPDPVALRVLKRFTFTEEDAAYQWEKLRSAYTLAEWSEEYFNNRALFSDYYLKERLTDAKLTPEWNEDVRPVGQQVFRHITTARKQYTRQPKSVIRAGLYEPLFDLLGFDIEAQAGAADYLLYAPGDKSKPIAAALTCVWNRNLDDIDEARELDEADGGAPFDIPGATVVSLLEAQTAPWVIVTNGKLWRLYSSTASNKATNYYEVDLEEAIAASDQITALKYWHLMFRREAFTGFLDDLLKQSADYGKELGDRLKDRVFVEIFPQFAKGFIADMRAKGITTFDDDTLAQVFSGTLTFLYRLMFTLYAESLELLPVGDAHGYREHSLYCMKNEIAQAGGAVLDQAAGRLSAHYQDDASGLYARLMKLFAVIDAGSDELNLPTYDGGLFSPETGSGQFLAAYAIPDRYLALGFDRLARDLDDRTQALVFVDFKSLGVRQLGSIYEGLLEFKLKIAGEALAVTKEKGREVYQPAKKVKKPLAVINAGEVYLENDKQERKATGSYYTPDYIVKYIVRHTVGPVLDRKFEALEPRLREAQKAYRQSRDLARAKREDPEKFWNRDDMRLLVDDCLNVRALDPAMGSGHFLVEVVDYVSTRLIDFLNGWSENPVWAFIERTRADILGDMERQGVTIDADRLNRVSLLKRAVLKRCIYGVDLNAMAVELAKVSLWLDAFTLGAPLSFLDHHLKHGNSLIGARVRDVQEYLKGYGGAETMDMFSGSRFAGVMLATDLMRQVSYLSDNTVEQTRRSAEAYRSARDHLAPYKRVLDVYTSRWFGNPIPKKNKTDTVRLFLQDPQTEAWLRDPAKPLDNSLIPADAIAETALHAAADKRFFHWELEFPEVFFAPGKPGGQDVQLREDGGFDAVVGNPPYDELSEDALGRAIDEREYLTDVETFKPAQESSGRLNWYHYFMVLALQLLTAKGRSGLIVPMSWMGDSFTFGVRKWMLEHHRPTLIEAFPQKDNPFERIFFDAKLPTSVFVAEKNHDTGAMLIRVHPGKNILQTPHFTADPNIIKNLNPDTLLIPLVDHNGWQVLELLVTSDNIGQLSDLAAEPTSGEIIFNASTRPYMSRKQKPGYKLILRGSHVQRYEMVEEAKQGIPEYLDVKAYLENSREDSKAYAHRSERIVYQEGSAIDAWRRVVPAYLPEGNICGHKICYFVNYKIDKFAFLAVFASNIVNWLVEKLSVTNSLPVYLIGNLPFPRIAFTTPAAERAALLAEAQALYARCVELPSPPSPLPQGEGGAEPRGGASISHETTHSSSSPLPEGEGLGVRAEGSAELRSGASISHETAPLASDSPLPKTSSGSPLPEGEGLGVRASEGVRATSDIERFREMASRTMVEAARTLRQEQTSAETLLWECLRSRRLADLKFRRQHPIAKTHFVVDFFCYEHALVVELDGPIHDTQQGADQERQEQIETLGYHVLRFRNEQVFNDLKTVLITILQHCTLSASPPSELASGSPLPGTTSGSPLPEGEGLGVRASDPIKAILHFTTAALDAGKSDVVHDLLAHLAQRMIDLNKQKQAEVKRFLGWLEARLKIQPKKDGSTGIDSLNGKTIIQGYLGDYQKGQGELPWRDFLYRLHQNRRRFGVSLSDVEGEIQRAYEQSLETLLPIKRDLARTDALIDKIVYRLYGLTDAEIELIERPQYEQALADAKAQAVADEKIDDEAKIERIAEGILPAARRYFERVEPRDVEAALDGELPNWRALPPDAPTFILTGDYNLQTLPDHMDFSASVVPYTKAVEVTLTRRFFEPFRAAHPDADCRNKFLQDFMRGERELTLGSYMIILSSSKEAALRGFIGRTLPDVEALAAALNDEAMRDIRNKAAHDEVTTRDEARQTRAWALGILGMV